MSITRGMFNPDDIDYSTDSESDDDLSDTDSSFNSDNSSFSDDDSEIKDNWKKHRKDKGSHRHHSRSSGSWLKGRHSRKS